MRKTRLFLTLLTAFLLVATTVLPAAAVDKECKRQQTAEQKAGKCAQQREVQREKPVSSSEAAAYGAAPRELPAVNVAEAQRARAAAEVLADLPEELAEKAEAIAVIPGVKKAAFVIGGRWGKGLISVRGSENGQWIPPSFIEISGGSLGFQLGIQSTDLVLVFTDADAVNSLLRGKLTLNGQASAAAGPIGRDAQAGVDLLMSSGILSYSHAKGLFAGVSLDGSVITIDDTSNHKVYGKYINGDEILIDRRVASNEVVSPFLDALDQHMPPATRQAGL
jgi:lipid-binding SYLF domain-containing protein